MYNKKINCLHLNYSTVIISDIVNGRGITKKDQRHADDQRLI